LSDSLRYTCASPHRAQFVRLPFAVIRPVEKEITMTQPKARYRRVPGVASLTRSWPILGLVPALLAATSTSAGAVNSSIVSNFNGTAIAAGRTIWFSAVFKYSGPTGVPVHIQL